jgi:hypothetical protein
MDQLPSELPSFHKKTTYQEMSVVEIAEHIKLTKDQDSSIASSQLYKELGKDRNEQEGSELIRNSNTFKKMVVVLILIGIFLISWGIFGKENSKKGRKNSKKSKAK